MSERPGSGPRPPVGLKARGRRLWADLAEGEKTLTPPQLLLLEEAARTADRLEQLDGVIRGKGVDGLLHLRHMHDSCSDNDMQIVLTVDGVLAEARQQQNALRQMLSTLVTTLRPAVEEEPDVDAADEIAQRRAARRAAAAGQ